VQTQYVVPLLTIQDRPPPITLDPVTFYTVTDSNKAQFEQRFRDNNGGEYTFVALSIVDYETLALNIGKMRQYIEQQQAVIEYYERLIKAVEVD